MSVVPTSPAGSTQGWSFWVWLRRNKSSVKTVAALGFAYVTSLVPGIHPPLLQAFVASFVGIFSRFALDWLDFYLSEVQLA